jgi:hypothetical protein
MFTRRHIWILALSIWTASTAAADVGIVLYESKGVDSRRTNSGHLALLATHLCAEGIDQVRACNAGEEPGVVITRYLNLAYGYDRSVFVAPLRPHFTATTDPDQVPALINDQTLRTMQIAYWRTHLRPYLAPLSQERYQKLRHDVEGDAGRTLRGLLSLETELGALEPHKKESPTEPIALIDPVTQELVPNGLWREAIGAAYARTAMMITAPATPEQEARLINFVAAVNKQPFQALADNCSDFVERGLFTVFSDSGLRFRPRILNIADAWVTNPLRIATDFLAYTKRQQVPVTVTRVPMIAGTRRPTAKMRSLTRGALVPDPSQGKLMFGIKVAVNIVNPLLGASAYTVDKLSRFANLDSVAHQQATGGSREQVRIFGTSSCWKAKQEQFAALTTQAHRLEILSSPEEDLLLKRDRPFLLPQYYAAGTAEGVRVPAAFGATRAKVREMADSSDRQDQATAFRIMTAVINYDLTSEPVHRRASDDFGRDWDLFLLAAEKNGITVSADSAAHESLADCSCREFDANTGTRDAFAESLAVHRRLARTGREIIFGRNH